MPDTPPIVDAFCRVGPWVTREPAIPERPDIPGTPGQPYTMEALLAEHARFGIGQRLCVHFESLTGWTDEGNAAMTALARSSDGTGVIWTAQPPRRFGAPPVEEVLAAARREGVAMFTLSPTTQSHPLAVWANADLYAAMQEARLPLLLSGETDIWRDVHEIAAAYPRLPILLWNVMYGQVRTVVPLMDLHPGIQVCIAPRFVRADAVENFTHRYGPGRLIYGSSWPVVDYPRAMQSPGPLIAMVMYARVSDDNKAAILGGNIRRLVSEVAWRVQGFGGEEGQR